jgi:asparagine synthase (glutamine-hydrolysing)
MELSPTVAELWPRLIWHLDEPIADPAAIACYLICKLAREHGIKVLLSGQGGDELFCGYPRYLVMHLTRWVGLLPTGARRMISSFAHLLSGAKEGSIGALMRRVRRGLMG